MFDGRPERNLLVRGHLVVASMEGRKTNTRRVPPGRYVGWKKRDLIYVKESYRFPKIFDDKSPSEIAEMALDANYDKPWCPTRFEADGRGDGTCGGDFGSEFGRLRPSIHMPKWAARLWLELTEDVTVEPVQDITPADCFLEGPPVERCGPDGDIAEAYAWFREVWDEINAIRGYPWASNPEVAVIRYRVVSTTGRPG